MPRIIDVKWSEEDHEFVATCPDYPSLSWVSTTPAEAAESLEELINQTEEEERHGLQ